MLALALLLATDMTCGVLVDGDTIAAKRIAQRAAEEACTHAREQSKPVHFTSIFVHEEAHTIRWTMGREKLSEMVEHPNAVAATIAGPLFEMRRDTGRPWTIDIDILGSGDVSLRGWLVGADGEHRVALLRWNRVTMREPLKTLHKPTGEQIQEP